MRVPFIVRSRTARVSWRDPGLRSALAHPGPRKRPGMSERFRSGGTPATRHPTCFRISEFIVFLFAGQDVLGR